MRVDTVCSERENDFFFDEVQNIRYIFFSCSLFQEIRSLYNYTP